ncbi:MAG: uracil-DNA glycosylase [Mycoplasma sp.]
MFLVNNLRTNWFKFIEEELSKPYLIKIDNFLKNSDKVFFPQKEDIFNAFNFFNIEDTKVVILGQDPYHGPKQAHGLAFSISKESKVKNPPSLNNIFKEIQNEFGYLRINGDLTDWAEQGILLLNSCLTVYEGQANSHQKWGWNNLLINAIELINKECNNICFLLLGNDSKKYAKYIDVSKHEIIERSHPSPLSANQKNALFFNSDIFTGIDKYLIKNKGIKIKW